MRLQRLILGLMLMLPTGLLQADEDGEARHYVGINSESFSKPDVSGMSIKYGYDFGNTFSMELQYGNSGTISTGAVLEIDSFYSLFFRGNKRYGNLTLFALVGGSSVTFNTTTVLGDEYSGGAYGVGIDMFGSKNTAITLSWMRHVDLDETAPLQEVDALTLGLTHHFDISNTVARY